MTWQENPPEVTRVLIVDDDQDTRLLYRTFLTMEGFDVADAGDAESALRDLETTAPHVVVTDLVLPGRGGVALAAAIRDSRRHVAVIALTGRVSSDLNHAHREAFDAILTKPCPLEVLCDAILNATAGRPLTRRPAPDA